VGTECVREKKTLREKNPNAKETNAITKPKPKNMPDITTNQTTKQDDDNNNNKGDEKIH